MRAWQFKQKTIGFGIAKTYYLTVLTGSAALPSISDVINTKGESGRLEGFGVPLDQGASKDDLQRPMQRGAYAFATKDRKTVVRMFLLSKEEAGYHPEEFLRTREAQGLSPELIARIRATWSLMQLTFETHHPMVHDSLKFILQLAERLGVLTDGVIADPVAKTFKLPDEVFTIPQADELVDARDHVKIHVRPRDKGHWLFSLGMQKFGLPELELSGVDSESLKAGGSLLLSICQNALLGAPAKLGQRFGAPDNPLQVSQGGLETTFWGAVTAHELIPVGKEGVNDCLKAWQEVL
ncbi:MAG TPA: hypothetical protein VEX38_10335 [Fimbriimonadaceae bacterium]|nr:hypothetical protein [Fimbriimonadaceae bacterium]